MEHMLVNRAMAGGMAAQTPEGLPANGVAQVTLAYSKKAITGLGSWLGGLSVVQETVRHASKLAPLVKPLKRPLNAIGGQLQKGYQKYQGWQTWVENIQEVSVPKVKRGFLGDDFSDAVVPVAPSSKRMRWLSEKTGWSDGTLKWISSSLATKGVASYWNPTLFLTSMAAGFLFEEALDLKAAWSNVPHTSYFAKQKKNYEERPNRMAVASLNNAGQAVLASAILNGGAGLWNAATTPFLGPHSLELIRPPEKIDEARRHLLVNRGDDEDGEWGYVIPGNADRAAAFADGGIQGSFIGHEGADLGRLLVHGRNEALRAFAKKWCPDGEEGIMMLGRGATLAVAAAGLYYSGIGSMPMLMLNGIPGVSHVLQASGPLRQLLFFGGMIPGVNGMLAGVTPWGAASAVVSSAVSLVGCSLLPVAAAAMYAKEREVMAMVHPDKRESMTTAYRIVNLAAAGLGLYFASSAIVAAPVITSIAGTCLAVAAVLKRGSTRAPASTEVMAPQPAAPARAPVTSVAAAQSAQAAPQLRSRRRALQLTDEG